MSKKNQKKLNISKEEMLNSISNNSKLDGIHENDDMFFQFVDTLITEQEQMEKPDFFRSTSTQDEIKKNKLKEILFGEEEAVPLKNTIKKKVGIFDTFKKDFLPKLELILSPRPVFGILGASILLFYILSNNSIENINNTNTSIYRSGGYSDDQLVYVEIENKNLVIKQFDDLDRDIKIYKDDKLFIQKSFSDLEEKNNEMMIILDLKDGSYKLVISFFSKILLEKNFIISD